MVDFRDDEKLITEARRALAKATGFVYTRDLAERLLAALVEVHERLQNVEIADREHDHEFEDCCLICGVTAFEHYSTVEVPE